MIDWAERARSEIQKTADRGTAKTDKTPLPSELKGVSAVMAVRHLPISENLEPTTASPRVELMGLIKAVGTLYAFTPSEFEEATQVAFADPQAALTSFRDVAKRYGLNVPADDRITCGECLRLVKGRCGAAKLGLMADTQPDYSPGDVDIPHRCAYFVAKDPQ
jgi:hypothetical protein